MTPSLDAALAVFLSRTPPSDDPYAEGLEEVQACLDLRARGAQRAPARANAGCFSAKHCHPRREVA